ncbi:MAG: HlyD family secretion protein [Coprobacter sp.]|nr:HlyD family secretion protein [Coprobacter sp.]
MEKNRKYLAFAFIVILVAVIAVSVTGILLSGHHPIVLQGEIECTEIRISGKLPGRIDTFLVKEGQPVKKGDTLVVINSPEATAKLNQANALENVARYQNQKVDRGTRSQVTESMLQLWNKAKSDLQLARTTYNRINNLYKDSVVTLQRKDEAEALYKAASANEKAAYQQYLMAADGAEIQDKESARSLVNAAKGSVEEVEALLRDARLTAPESGQISAIYPKRGELVGAGSPIMSLVVLEDAHVVLNVREDLLPRFKMGGRFNGDIPALGEKGVGFEINYISPLGSYATWKSTRQTGSYDMKTFEIHAVPDAVVPGLRPGMSVLVSLSNR